MNEPVMLIQTALFTHVFNYQVVHVLTAFMQSIVDVCWNWFTFLVTFWLWTNVAVAVATWKNAGCSAMTKFLLKFQCTLICTNFILFSWNGLTDLNGHKSLSLKCYCFSRRICVLWLIFMCSVINFFWKV